MSLALTACAGGPQPGLRSSGFVSAAIGQAYIPLHGSAYVVLDAAAAGVVIAPGIAVTNAHNANLIDPANVIGVSRDYDLLFFRTSRTSAPPMGELRVGVPVIAYGEGRDSVVREASGPVTDADAPVEPRCAECSVQHAFTYRALGGPGFSGGPVVDLHTGRLVGITFAFRDGPDDRHPDQRLMYGFGLKRVFEELGKLKGPQSP